MTLPEALLESKDNGKAYERESGVEWFRYHPTHTYKISAEDIMADDWVPVGPQESK